MLTERKMVLLYNHADPDESFVAMLTDEEIATVSDQETDLDQETYDLVKSRRVEMPTFCYYA